MTLLPSPVNSEKESRREFLATSAGLATASLVLPALATSVHAAGSDTLRVGLIGCGNRGTGAAEQALLADRTEAFGESEVPGLLRHDAGELSPADGEEAIGLTRHGGQVRKSGPASSR